MAEILASLVGPAIELGKCIAAPIKRQLNYLFCFNSNIRSLNMEVQNLNAARNDLQREIAVAEGNREVISDEVRNWLTSDNEIQPKITGIETQIPNVQSGCLTIKSRFSLSRKAKKMTEAVKEHRCRCKFDRISWPAPPPSMLPIPLGDAYEFHSRKHVEEEIMEALRDNKEFNMMGIHGMGGVGKTIMAKRIMNRVREENLFNEVVMAIVSQKVDVFIIQREIAESLGLKLQEESLSARAIKLHEKLMDKKKRTLVVLDDVWEKTNLEDIGIPCQRNFQWCTILFTSRNMDVLKGMGVQKVCQVKTLTEREAWFLFIEKAGNWLDNSNLLSIANQIAEECKGLPIALVTVGCALKDEKKESIWKSALDQLKNLNAMDMPDVIREVYNPLKLSYELLGNQLIAKSLFLLCSLFPEDSDISLDYLTMYSVGLCMFGGMKLGQARGRVFRLVEMLKSRSLLLGGRDEDHVKMHDVVRDVAIFISSEEGLVDATLSSMNRLKEHSHSDCKWISVSREIGCKLPNIVGSNFGRLQLLIMHCSSYKSTAEIENLYFLKNRRTLEIENLYFLEVMEELRVLSFISIWSKSLPQKIQLRKNLRTLHLDGCSLETVSVVGEELMELEILCCRFCNNIKELPVEIGRLNRLKLLEFSCCKNLKSIAPGIIPNLVELEELKMVESFNSWESTGRKNVSLKELESLFNLTHLKISISDYTLAAQEIRLSSISSIAKYCIQINIHPGASYDWQGHEKCMYLKLPIEITMGSWVREFLASTEALILEGDGSNNLILLQAHKHMKFLKFEACSTMKKLVDTTSSDWRTVGDVFPILECMSLKNLNSLEEICDSSILEGSNSFKNFKYLELHRLPALKHLWKSSPNQNLSISNLRSIHIYDCGKLCNLLSLAIAKNSISQLEEITIINCEMMEQVLSNEEKEKDGGDHSHHQVITFPKLNRLKLFDLQSLTTFCRQVQSVEFHVMTEMRIGNCPKLRSLVSSSCSTGGHDNDESNCHLFCNQKDSPCEFSPMLESLDLMNLLNLEEICDGSLLEEYPNYFKNLKHLEFEKLPVLKHLWKSSPNQNVSLTKLSSIHIRECGKLRYLLSLAITEDAFLQLEELVIEDCELMEEFISIEENKMDGGDQSHCRQIITFSKLKRLVLLNLPSFTTLCRGIKSIEFPTLEEMEIRGCTMLTSLSSSIGNNHQNLTCDNDDDSLHLFCEQKVAFGSLKYLKIRFDNINISNIWCHQMPLDFFSGLETLEITYCGSIRSLFSSSIAGDLVNLKCLEINNCQEMEKVVADEEMLCEKPPFHRLENLTLSNLPKLRSIFCIGNLVNLKWLRIEKCKQIEKVIVNEKKLWEKSSFHRLEKLTLLDLPKLRSFCIENLVNLKVLIIKRCDEIEKVIGDEEKLCKKSPFPMLEQLELEDLPKLRNFCKGSCDLELPCLEQVRIDKCPLMENFTIGSLSTPKLKLIVIGKKYLKDMRDFNDAIKQLHFKSNQHLRISNAQESTSSCSAKGKEGEERNMRINAK